MHKPTKTIVRFGYVQQVTGMSRAACYREMGCNPDFPKRIKLGVRTIGFDASEVDAFVAKIIERGSIFWLKNED
tara:strand:- start:89 stop:310 length:222 start_codon:yes stop_codon:yes gene_type:complete